MPRSITLTRQATEGSEGSYNLIVVASDGEMMDNEIFKYYQEPLNPLDLDAGNIDTFTAICTPSDLETLPIGSPSETSDFYFRSDTLDIIYDDASEADDAWDDIIDGVTDLVRDLNAVDNLGSPEVFTVT